VDRLVRSSRGPWKKIPKCTKAIPTRQLLLEEGRGNEVDGPRERRSAMR
jgi:hypothetical protein